MPPYADRLVGHEDLHPCSISSCSVDGCNIRLVGQHVDLPFKGLNYRMQLFQERHLN